ncbi:hypothetical protein Kirov_238 [Bacillus phage Kirov]|uniref:Uncharacterized protein n=1 Tax=Bacillus phage Kirov TaxID=2783539 RepID=A0A7U3NK06_9CAUD|nr:hypothetical protein PQE67_gp066 [Bacillus phage Kirov]QOV08437.1 hypothetical protein Kirov_238 [Bacillus phage Kirov]
MRVDFYKVELPHNNFELYEIHCDNEKIGKFIYDERETNNSLIAFKKGLALSTDLLWEISCELHRDFGNVKFVMGYDI